MFKKPLSPVPTSSKDNTALVPDDLTSSSKGSSATLCGVCGERTKNKNYGAYSCSSCKIFFRRSILDSQIYICKQNENCILTQGERKGCRACRLAKCLKIGMNPKKAAKWNMTTEVIELPFLTALRQPSLLHARTEMPLSINRIAHITDMLDDFHRKFVLYADWLNEFRDFRTLPEHVQLVLAKAGSIKYSLEISAWRSFQLDCCGISISNGAFLPKYSGFSNIPDPRDTVSIFLHNVVEVMKSLNIDETEFILLKIIILFTEDSPALNELEKKLVREKRDKYIALLTSYIHWKYPRLVEKDAACRVGELMLLLSSITHTAHTTSDTMTVIETFRIAPLTTVIIESYKDPIGPQSSDDTSTS